ncbi:FAD-dependent oxidoreductase [Saccharopolyspora cebuensis]|uniref:FAD-dependent oxidoreductase n=1 Tax=Saccharopolyspora cebuensis TaxID=418759 RepID=A0ABV4CN31_9PSEU
MSTQAQTPAALVIGAGVIGLSTAITLRQHGWRVTVAAADSGPGIVSTVAGALWEWPPSVCGRHHDETLLEQSKSWAMVSYRQFQHLATHPEHTGVHLRPAVSYFHRPVDEQPLELAKMHEVAAHVPGFAHDPGLIDRHGINPRAGVLDAYQYTAPMVDTDRYNAWLRDQALATGVRLVPRRITGDLRDHESALLTEFDADVIVNCSGLGARELAGDTTLSPHRGALLWLRNDGTSMPRITTAHALANDPSSPQQDMVFIVPRGQDRLLVGGIVEDGTWNTDLTPDNYPPVRDMLRRCQEFLPALADAELDTDDPVRVGLRPFRRDNVRLETEAGTRIVHNYGHGGAGVTLSWGCADDATQLAHQLVGNTTAPAA